MKRTWSGRIGRHCKSIALAVQVVGMAFVYQQIWEWRPDYFRVESKLNDLPLDLYAAARSYSVTSGRPLPQFTDPDVDAAVARIRGAYRDLQARTAVIDGERRALDARRKAEQQDNVPFQASMWRQAEAYRKSRTAPFDSQLAAIARQQQNILDAHHARTNEELPAGPDAIRHADLAIKAAELRVKAIQADIDASDHILKNLNAFQRQPAQQAYLARLRETAALEKRLSDHQLSIYDLNGRLYDAFAAYLTAAKAKLGYLDFLYFSLGGATTANFGDIAPNHSIVRALYSAQIVISMVLVAWWINDFISGKPRRRRSRRKPAASSAEPA